jgi:amino acid permease
MELITSLNYKPSNKAFFDRCFSKINEGSLRASIMSITTIALGPGCLALPAKFKEIGFSFMIILILLGSLIAYWSLKIMIIASKKLKVDEYGKIATKAFGKYMGWFIDGVIVFYVFGVLISYQVIGIY